VAITNDPDEAARAPMGDAIVADVALTLEALVGELEQSSRDAPEQRAAPGPLAESDPMSPSTAVAALADVFPDDGIVVLESPSSTLAVRNRLRLSRPGSYFFGAGGGLGFGLAASVGVQMAKPDRPVVCVIGEGSVQYAVQSLWTAVAYDVPLTVLVLRNEEYAILKWFAGLEQVEGAPGLDLPNLDSVAVAAGYGVRSRAVGGREELRTALGEALSSGAPELIEVTVQPGMTLG
jgi:benzoylformate decarboxylase